MKKYFLITIICFFLCPLLTHAARFSVEVPKTLQKNEQVLGNFLIHTDESINAVSGDVVFPSHISNVTIVDGASAITFWIEKPVFNKETHTITFSGLTPGGITGDRALFSFIFSSSVAGPMSISTNNLSALKNDGRGTVAAVSFSPSRFTIGSKEATTTLNITDTTPPEEFTPTLSKSADLFENKPFLTFATQDKGVGIDHYEYAAAYFGSPSKESWERVESPFAPSNANGKKIFIKAVDKFGNERVGTIAGPNYYVYRTMWVIIIVLLITCALYISKRLLL